MADTIVDYNSLLHAGWAFPVDDLTNQQRVCQIFTASETYVLTKIAVRGSETNSCPGNAQVWIYNATDSGPTGAILDTATIVASSFPPAGSPGWINFTMTGGVTLTSGNKYGIVFAATSANPPGTGYLNWSYSEDNIIGGLLYTTDLGSTWLNTYFATYDCNFRTYKDAPASYVDISGTITGTSSVSGTLGMAAKNPNPANAFSGMGLDWQTFSWESGSSVPPADEVYNVYFGTSVDNLSLIVSEGPDINFAAAYLAAVVGMGGYSSTYYWRVDTYFQNSQETIQGDVWSFSTIVFDFPPGGARGVGGGFGGDDGSGEAIGYGGGTFGDKQIHTKTRLIGFARNTLYYENL